MANSMDEIFLKNLRSFINNIDVLWNDPAVTTLFISHPDLIWLERPSGLEKRKIFLAEPQLQNIALSIAQFFGILLNEENPQLHMQLPSGTKVSVFIPPLVSQFPVITIKKYSQHHFSLDELVQQGFLTESVASFLVSSFLAHQTILLVGPPASGKTTLFRALTEMLPDSERLLLIQEYRWENFEHPQLISLLPPSSENYSNSSYSIRDLLFALPSLYPHRILLEELYGLESIDFIHLLNTAYQGSLATIKAPSILAAFHRLESFFLREFSQYPLQSLRATISNAFQLVVYCQRYPNSQRLISKIVEVQPLDQYGNYRFNPLFQISPIKHHASKKQQLDYQLLPTGIIPSFWHHLQLSGFTEFDEDFFNPSDERHHSLDAPQAPHLPDSFSKSIRPSDISQSSSSSPKNSSLKNTNYSQETSSSHNNRSDSSILLKKRKSAKPFEDKFPPSISSDSLDEIDLEDFDTMPPVDEPDNLEDSLLPLTSSDISDEDDDFIEAPDIKNYSIGERKTQTHDSNPHIIPSHDSNSKISPSPHHDSNPHIIPSHDSNPRMGNSKNQISESVQLGGPHLASSSNDFEEETRKRFLKNAAWQDLQSAPSHASSHEMEAWKTQAQQSIHSDSGVWESQEMTAARIQKELSPSMPPSPPPARREPSSILNTVDIIPEDEMKAIQEELQRQSSPSASPHDEPADPPTRAISSGIAWKELEEERALNAAKERQNIPLDNDSPTDLKRGYEAENVRAAIAQGSALSKPHKPERSIVVRRGSRQPPPEDLPLFELEDTEATSIRARSSIKPHPPKKVINTAKKPSIPHPSERGGRNLSRQRPARPAPPPLRQPLPPLESSSSLDEATIIRGRRAPVKKKR